MRKQQKSRKEKRKLNKKSKQLLKRRILLLPKDFTFEELESPLFQLGFVRDNKGKTSGSRVRFYQKEKHLQCLDHKPHPQSIIKEKALKDIVDFLKENKPL